MTDTAHLEQMANKLRIHSLISTTQAGSGHPTSCLSIAELISVLFFQEMREGDEIILSKGHAAPILWAAFAEAGLLDIKDLDTLRKIDSNLEGHPTFRVPQVKVATGSLGQGLSAGVGMALAKKMEQKDHRIFVILGDGEVAEGSIWEAANTAAFYKLKNLVALVDVNRLGQSQPTMHGHDVEAYVQKFSAFGWNAMSVDGHSIMEIKHALNMAQGSPIPSVIVAKTLKGKGVSFLEDQEDWHGKPLPKDQLQKALHEIQVPEITLPSAFKQETLKSEIQDYEMNSYSMGEMVATRNAYGKALLAMGSTNPQVVCLDGDVKNSTMGEYFFKKYPQRSFEAFIAEQNMVGMAIGIASMGYIPFAATFATFFTRAYDFIRMGVYSNANIKLVGSHAGVSIGADGPSQMGLEDLPMFLSLPEAVVLYPSDAVSTEKLVREMAKHRGISYLRTTREKTPVLYPDKEEFPIGGYKILKESDDDKALIIAAGITLHEALSAAESLEEKGIPVRVMDLYSIKPIDAAGIVQQASSCQNQVLVVEDHYCSAIGGVISQILPQIQNLCIKEIPRSGPPRELMNRYGIDAESIVKQVSEIVK